VVQRGCSPFVRAALPFISFKAWQTDTLICIG
jgi:hypothetical protein